MNLNYVDDAVYQEFRRILDQGKLPAEKYDVETMKILRKLRLADSRVSQQRAAAVKEKLNGALKQIRKDLNIYARVSFSCCGSCGSYELENKCAETGKRGYMFYSRQAKDALYEDGQVYFNFGVAGDGGSDSNYSKTRELGTDIVKILKKNYIKVEWDGSPLTSILVKAG